MTYQPKHAAPRGDRRYTANCLPHNRPRETDPAAIAAALDAAMRSGAVAEVNARRLEQITRHGHTPAMDARKSLGQLMRIMSDHVSGAMDHAGYSDHPHADRLRIARTRIITAAAMALAIIDRIDADLAAMDQQEGQL